MSIAVRDRRKTGRLLARKLAAYAGRSDVLVLALPRGGPVAFEIARTLKLALDVCLVCRLGVPGLEHLAVGVITSGGGWMLNEGMIEGLGVPDRLIREAAERALRELKQLELAYRGDRPTIAVQGRTLILVDGASTIGSSTRMASAALRRLGPARLVVVLSTAPDSTDVEIPDGADEVVWALRHRPPATHHPSRRESRCRRWSFATFAE